MAFMRPLAVSFVLRHALLAPVSEDRQRILFLISSGNQDSPDGQTSERILNLALTQLCFPS